MRMAFVANALHSIAQKTASQYRITGGRKYGSKNDFLMSLLIVNLKQIEFNASMKNLVAKVVRAGGRSGVLGLVYALPLVPLSCPAGVRAAEGATVEVETPPVKGITYLEAPAAAAAFGEFQAILRGYSDVFLESEVLSILKEKEISLLSIDSTTDYDN